MTDIFPFKGTRYNSRLIEDMKAVISPSFDTLSFNEQSELRKHNSNNILHIIPETMSENSDDGIFLKAASMIHTWRRDGVLVNDSNKSYYLYEQVYAKAVDGCKSRKGLFALVNLDCANHASIKVEGQTPYISNSCLKNLLRAANCNVTPIPMLFRDSKDEFGKIVKEILKSRPWEEIEDVNGDIHRLWVINKKNVISSLTEFFRDKKCIIIDGHQKYEVAYQYRDEQREVTGAKDGNQPFDYILSFMLRFEDKSICAKPVHRVLSPELGSGIDPEEIIEDLGEFFSLDPVELNIKEPEIAADIINSRLNESGEVNISFGMVLPDSRAFIVSLKNDVDFSDLYDEEVNLCDEAKKLQCNILHHYIIRQLWIGNPEVELEEEDLLYFRDATDAMKMLSRRQASAVFFLNPCSMKSLADVVKAGGVIPPFTLRLYPPLVMGLVIRDMTVRH
jgi:uncharacterized protein (DUF1015 family)